MIRKHKLQNALERIAVLRTDGSRDRCQYCECDAGGMFVSGEKLDHHEDWCPTVLACIALGITPKPEQR